MYGFHLSFIMSAYTRRISIKKSKLKYTNSVPHEKWAKAKQNWNSLPWAVRTNAWFIVNKLIGESCNIHAAEVRRTQTNKKWFFAGKKSVSIDAAGQQFSSEPRLKKLLSAEKWKCWREWRTCRSEALYVSQDTFCGLAASAGQVKLYCNFPLFLRFWSISLDQVKVE